MCASFSNEGPRHDGDPEFDTALSLARSGYSLENVLTPCINELIKVASVDRLQHVLQSFGVRSTRLSQRGYYHSHSRLNHCLDVYHELSRMVEVKVNSGEMSVLEAAAVVIAGFLHDIGQSAFSHIGEAIIRANGSESFDHDLHTLVLASQEEIQNVLRRHFGDSREILAILGACFLLDGDEDQRAETRCRLDAMCMELENMGLPGMTPVLRDLLDNHYELMKERRVVSQWVQDFSDMCAYLIRDVEESPEDKLSLWKVEKWLPEAQESLLLDADEMVLTDLTPFTTVAMILADKEKTSILANCTALANARLGRDLARSEITNKELIAGNDVTLLQRLPRREQEIFDRGVDYYFREIIDGVLPCGGVNLQEVMDDIAAARAALKIRESDVIIGVTPHFNKRFRFRLEEKALVDVLKIPPEGLVLNRLDEKKYEDDPIIVTITRTDRNHVEINMAGKRTIVAAVRLRERKVPEEAVNMQESVRQIFASHGIPAKSRIDYFFTKSSRKKA